MAPRLSTAARREERCDKVAFLVAQPGESSKAFHAFSHYRDLSADKRSIDAAYREHMGQCEGQEKSGKRAVRRWHTWSAGHAWVDRAAAHDADLSAKRRDRRARELAEAEDRAATIAKVALARLARRLESLDVKEIPAQVLDRWIKTLTDVELKALGHTDKIEHRGVDGAPLTFTLKLGEERDDAD